MDRRFDAGRERQRSYSHEGSTNQSKGSSQEFSKEARDRYNQYEKQFQSYSKYERSYYSGSGKYSDYEEPTQASTLSHGYSEPYDKTYSAESKYHARDYGEFSSSKSHPISRPYNSSASRYTKSFNDDSGGDSSRRNDKGSEYGHYDDRSKSSYRSQPYNRKPHYEKSYDNLESKPSRHSFSYGSNKTSETTGEFKYSRHGDQETRSPFDAKSFEYERPSSNYASLNYKGSASYYRGDTPSSYKESLSTYKDTPSSFSASYKDSVPTYKNTPSSFSYKEPQPMSDRPSYKSSWSNNDYSTPRYTNKYTSRYADERSEKKPSQMDGFKRYSSSSETYSSMQPSYTPFSVPKKIKTEEGTPSNDKSLYTPSNDRDKDHYSGYSHASSGYSQTNQNTSNYELKSPTSKTTLYSTKTAEKIPSKSLISSKRERITSLGQDDIFSVKSFTMPSAEQSADEDERADDNPVNQEIEQIDDEISHYERLLSRIKEDEVTDKSEDDEEEQVVVPDTVKAQDQEEPLHFRIYWENRILAHKNTKTKLSQSTCTERPHVYTTKIWASFEDYEFYAPNIASHATNRHSIAKLVAQRKISLADKCRKLRLEYKRLYEAWKPKAEKIDSRIQSALVKTPTLPPQPVSNSGGSVSASELAQGSRTNTGRRPVFTSDAVRSEAEWQAVLASLGIMDKVQDFSRYADVPDMIIDPQERQRLAYHSNDHVVYDPVYELKAHNDLMTMKWSWEDRELFKTKLGHYGKNFYKISNLFATHSTHDCIQYYYREKNRLNFKSYLKKCAKMKRKNALMKAQNQLREHDAGDENASDCDIDEDMTPTTIVHDQKPFELAESGGNSMESVPEKLASLVGNEGTKAIKNGDQQADKQPKVPGKQRRKSTAKLLKGEDKVRIIEALYQHGRNFEAISHQLGNKTISECQNFYEQYREKLRLGECILLAQLEQCVAAGMQPETQQLTLLEMLTDLYHQQNLEKVSENSQENDDSTTADDCDENISVTRTHELDSAQVLASDLSLVASASFCQLDEEAKKKRKQASKKKQGITEGSLETSVDDEASMSQGNDSFAASARRTVSYWSVAEKAEFLKALAKYGRNWEVISKQIGSKSAIQNRNYYHNFRQKLDLDRILQENGHSVEDDRNHTYPTTVDSDAAKESLEKDGTLRKSKDSNSQSSQHYPPYPPPQGYPKGSKKGPNYPNYSPVFVNPEDGSPVSYPAPEHHYRRPEDMHAFPPHYPRPYMYAHPGYPAHLYQRENYPFPPPTKDGYPPPFSMMQPVPYLPPHPPPIPGPNAPPGPYFRPGAPHSMPPFPPGPNPAFGGMNRYFRPGMMPPPPYPSMIIKSPSTEYAQESGTSLPQEDHSNSVLTSRSTKLTVSVEKSITEPLSFSRDGRKPSFEPQKTSPVSGLLNDRDEDVYRLSVQPIQSTTPSTSVLSVLPVQSNQSDQSAVLEASVKKEGDDEMTMALAPDKMDICADTVGPINDDTNVTNNVFATNTLHLLSQHSATKKYEQYEQETVPEANQHLSEVSPTGHESTARVEAEEEAADILLSVSVQPNLNQDLVRVKNDQMPQDATLEPIQLEQRVSHNSVQDENQE